MECVAKTLIDRVNPNVRHFKCLDGLIVISNLDKNKVDDTHEYNVVFERKVGKSGKEYGILTRYEIIHDLGSPKVVDERSEIAYNKHDDHYIRTVTTRRLMAYKCRRCGYEEMDEDKDTHDEEVDVILIDSIPYLLDHNQLSSLGRVDMAPEAEVKYVSVYHYYIPEDFIDTKVMSKVEELKKEIAEVDKKIQYINSYDVYLTGLGKFAKKVTNETKQYDPQHDLQVVIEEAYYVLENGTKMMKEIVKHRNYKCRQYLVPGHTEDWELRRECEFSETEVSETHDYGEIPVFKTNVYNDYMKQKDGLEQEIKKLLQQMVRSRVEVITQKDDDKRVKIKINGDEAEFLYDWMHGVEYYKGKYGPLARLFL